MTDFIGIVTVLFNSDEVLPGFFESLSKQKEIRYRLYVIDNSKSDSGSRLSRELADRYGIDAKIVFNDANVGVAKGNNQGIEFALGDGCNYVLLANNDIEFNNELLLVNLKNSLKEDNYSAIVPKIYFHGTREKIWFAGGRFNTLRATTPHLGEGEYDIAQYDDIKTMEYAPTCFVLISVNSFKKIGMMDEKYFVYYDDADFLWRMKKENLKVGFASKEIVLHKVSHSTGGDVSEFSLFYGARNRIYFIRKHYGFFMKFISLTFFLVTRCMKAISMSSGQRAAMLKGLRDGWSIGNN
jgi:GT2 family glycosyltransferase